MDSTSSSYLGEDTVPRLNEHQSHPTGPIVLNCNNELSI